jgi:hypothetical protein
MEEAPENGKESSYSAHAKGMNEYIHTFVYSIFSNAIKTKQTHIYSFLYRPLVPDLALSVIVSALSRIACMYSYTVVNQSNITAFVTKLFTFFKSAYYIQFLFADCLSLIFQLDCPR